MKWNSAWNRNKRREIKNSLGRYLAMLVIVALGVGFFSGLKVTKSAIVQTGDHYIDRTNLFDYRLISTLGLTREDERAMRTADGVQDAENAVSVDFLAVQPNGKEVVLKAHSITQEINQVSLSAGRMLERADECVADRRAYSENDIGKTIRVSENNDEETADQLKYDEYTIVGLVESVLYLNNERGTTKLAGGAVSAFLFVPRDGFSMDYDTEMYVTVRDRGGIFTQKYEDTVDAARPSVEQALEARAQLRYDEILDEVNEKIQEGQDKYDDGVREYRSERADAERQLADARQELKGAKDEIAAGARRLDANQKKINSGLRAYRSGMQEYESGKSQLAAEKKQAYARIADAQDELNSKSAQVEAGLRQIEDSGVLAQYEQLSQAIPQLEAALTQIEAAKPQQKQLEQQLAEVREGIDVIEQSGAVGQYQKLTEAEQQLETAIAQAEQARAQEQALRAQLAEVQAAKEKIERSGVLEQYEQLNTEIARLEDELAQLDPESEQAQQLSVQLAGLKAQKEQIEQSGVLGQYEQLNASAAQLEDALAQIPTEEQVDQLHQQLAAVQAGRQQIEESGVLGQYEQLKAAEQQLTEALAQFPSEEQEQQLRGQLAAAQAGRQQIEQSGVLGQYEQLKAARAQLRDGQKQLDGKKAQAERQLAAAQAKLNAGKSELDSAKSQLDTAQKQLNAGRRSLEDARRQYADGLSEYKRSKAKADKEFAKAEKELADALAKLDDARAERDDIQPAETYALDRMTNTGYVCFENDSAIVEGIAQVFPVFFFLVAALVCMTTMTRMVDEQRTQIGTFKALGYSDRDIMKKYIGYSGSAAVVGAVIGFFGGCRLFPFVLWKAYNMIYDFAEIEYVLDWKLAALSLAVALLCSAGATVAACRAELSRMPADLMRPKAPKPGKRVLLERITPLWSRMSFLHKVTVRNIFRYKKRLFMMVLGISGCTALVLTGFGVRDSIGNLAEDQYGSIMKFDYEISFADPLDEQTQAEFRQDSGLSDCVFLCRDGLDVVCKKGVQRVNFVATDDPELTGLIDFHRDGVQIPYPRDGEVLINEKLASLTGASVGDTISVQIDDAHTKEVRVGGIFENYVYNYAFMTQSTYETVTGEACEYQSAYARGAGGDLHGTAAKLVSDCGASAVSVTQDTKNMVANMMLSLNYVVWLVISCAGVLAFVVLFNLSNINLTERVREIATIKVLGFYPRETGAYVFRENIVLTALGALTGLPLGVALHRFVMSQIQVDIVSFQTRIFPVSFALALGVTFLFAFLVDLVMRRKLAHINMAESLKSIE